MSSTPNFNNFTTEEYPNAYGLKFSETKGACELAYSAAAGEKFVFPDGKVWEIIERKAADSGFLAILLKPENDDRIVFAFAGTQLENEIPGRQGGDLPTDFDQEKGHIPKQYISAAAESAEYKRRFGDKLILTGHSLGGGLAAYSCLVNRIPATTINPAALAESTALIYLASGNQCHIFPVTNYIAGGREFISSDGLWKTATAGRVTPRLLLIGKIVNVAGAAISGSRLVIIQTGFGPILIDRQQIKYYSDHLIVNTAPEIPLPVKIAKTTASAPAKFPVPVPVPVPTPNIVPTGTPAAR